MGLRARPGDLWKQGDTLRFTRSKDNKTLYAIALKWPGNQLTLTTVKPLEGSTITLLSPADVQPRALPWSSTPEGGVQITLGDAPYETGRPLAYAYAFKIEVEK